MSAATDLDEQVTNDLALELAPGVTLEFVRVAAGEFLMGSSGADKSARANEKPQHMVYLDEYFIGKYPVTVVQFAAFVQATGYEPMPEKHGDWQSPGGPESETRGNHPATFVNWEDAVAFCEWASRVTGRTVRLPTEAEWEKAARGTDGRLYPWGNTFDSDLLNRRPAFKGDSMPVGSHPGGASPYGALDMLGNVSEWCADRYAADYYKNSPLQNPTGPDVAHEDAEHQRVVRGGSFDIIQGYARCAYRDNYFPYLRDDFQGFRVAVSLAPNTLG
ncbi:MAG: formylglycine-generating enzyme family protein [Anaerolineae bacterium]